MKEIWDFGFNIYAIVVIVFFAIMCLISVGIFFHRVWKHVNEKQFNDMLYRPPIIVRGIKYSGDKIVHELPDGSTWTYESAKNIKESQQQSNIRTPFKVDFTGIDSSSPKDETNIKDA